MVILGSLDSALPPKSDRRVSLRKPPRQLSLGQDSLPASPLISTRNLVPGLSYSVVKLDRLGKGATSNVFRAVHTASLKMVALKEVMVSSDADRKAVRTEMRALRSQRRPLLNSAFTTELKSCPRIVDFYGSVARENGNACIAVEYVAGGSLSSWLDSGCKCPEAWIAHIAHQALEALDFLHTGGRVHRDVKPANILITRKGDVKLGDFGAAGVENSSRMIGTQRFMAPERLKGHRATPQSDLWSLGLSLATAAVGNDFILQASNEFEQLDLAGGARTMLAKATTISPELRDFLHRCLSRDPARRPALRELMKHPFLNQRFDWAKKCPEVAVAMRENRRRRRDSPTTLSTKAVLDALCEARAEDKLGRTPLDPITADDLAYELGVTAESLVRSVHRGTLELIRERGGRGGLRRIGGSIRGIGGLAGDPQRSKLRQCSLLSTLRDNGGWGVGGGDTSVSTLLGDDSANILPDSEGSFSSINSPPPLTAAYVQGESLKIAPFATVGNVASSSSGGRNNQRPADAVGTSTPDRGSSSTRKRLVEVSAPVKLTPHKRRGEKTSSQTKRHGSGRKDTHRSASAQPPDLTTADTRAAMRTREGPPTLDTSSISAPTEMAGLSRSGGDLCTAYSPTRASGEAGCDLSLQSSKTEHIVNLFETRKRPVRAVFHIADDMKAQMQVRDRVYRFKVYPACFSGREAVQWMLDGCHASSVDEAEKLGNEMMKASVFQHILNSQLFEDSSVYYQFTDGVTPPLPAKGGRRLRQVARVWGGHVARKFVQHGGANSGSGGTRERRVLERTNAAHANSATATKRSPAAQERICCRPGGGGRRSAEEGGDSELLAPATVSSFHVPAELGVNSLPNLPKSSSMDRKKHRRSRRPTTGKCKGQLRRFSSSVSTVTIPETPH